MAAPSKATVSHAAANTIVGPTVGWADATTSTSDEAIDLSDWAGRYVAIQAETADHYICFSDDATETIETGAAATVGTLAVPVIVYDGQPPTHVAVPDNKSTLIYRTVSGTGTLRVTPA